MALECLDELSGEIWICSLSLARFSSPRSKMQITLSLPVGK